MVKFYPIPSLSLPDSVENFTIEAIDGVIVIIIK
jgi:hypothetical protein